MITVVNKSTLCTDDEVKAMTRACATQVEMHAAPIWGQTPTPVVYAADEEEAPPGAWCIAIMDDADQADALGWHTEEQGDVIYGRVFARPVLDNGGAVLTGPLTVSSVLSHEVLETLVDPHVNLWADAGNGEAYALECCDAVESDSYPVDVLGVGRVSVSNFCSPHWFDPRAAKGEKFDFLGKVTAPFQMSKGGYVVITREGKVHQKYGEEYPEWRKQTKLADTSRNARRVRR
ncbi:hypothetical protein [Streptomyces camelliae]|uniref:DUF3846 domain-containing protein n=1 Tax=Streptomyces camelliae TaxID=3004093 RepID=A0ABY7NWS9_9ACTN|nr:hypothetical protein [Streptomyces sp. HUAS 2-6]WBO62520.1 hypothetical protein O1G22_06645 [Streptomyces sp. HUAS 2-6]